MCVLSYIAQ